MCRSLMKIGQDILIFTKTKGYSTIALLSLTLTRDVQNDTVLLPVCSWSNTNKMGNTFGPPKSSLKIILRYSSLENAADIKNIFDGMPKTGTLISIANLRGVMEGEPELDFDEDTNDVRLPRKLGDHPIKYSLRSYLESLYLISRVNIILRSENINNIPRPARLFKPVSFLRENLNIIMGWNADPSLYLYEQGINIYQNNRLISFGHPLEIKSDKDALVVLVETSYEVNENKDSLLREEDLQKLMSEVMNHVDPYIKNLKAQFPGVNLAVEAIRSGGIELLLCSTCNKWRLQTGNGSSCSALLLPSGKSYDCSIEESTKLFEELNIGYQSIRKRRRMDMEEEPMIHKRRI
eukprot:TRINITY_DN3244_c0_g1_i2.p1 TRINITY_DN3244_c0_g1~~TRINITY_DN3244_c0_g1_i2.p1  ORF type:complete len:350 (-),score=71.19 TRINITY_DN3244_c0_g1_i2:7-1056(-)